MPAKKYLVELTQEERKSLQDIVGKGKVAANKRRHAEILLKADQSPEGDSWNDEKIKEAFGSSISTIERIRKVCVLQGLEASLERKKRKRSRAKVLDGKQEAHLITLACQDPPEGFQRWSLRLLTEKMIELEHVETLSYETTRRYLKKHNLSLG